MDFVNLFNFMLELNNKELLLLTFGFFGGLFIGYLFCKKFCKKFKFQAEPQAELKGQSFFFRCVELKTYTPLFTKQGTKITHTTCDYYNKGKCEITGEECHVFKKIQ